MNGIDLPILTAVDSLPELLDPSVLLVDKPSGMSSFGVVRRVRRLADVKRVGHAGTLDPLATGLLIVLVGRQATRQQDAFMGLPKVYEATVRLGQSTTTYDAEGDITEERDPSGITDEQLAAAFREFQGDILQYPPIFSAIKVGGERLYKKARRGETIELEPRRVTISGISILGRSGADVDIRVECSKGTYIRSLAHDVGKMLGVGAHLAALRRMAIGSYVVDNAWTLDNLAAALDPS